METNQNGESRNDIPYLVDLIYHWFDDFDL